MTAPSNADLKRKIKALEDELEALDNELQDARAVEADLREQTSHISDVRVQIAALPAQLVADEAARARSLDHYLGTTAGLGMAQAIISAAWPE